MTVTTLNELADQAANAIHALTQRRTFDEARAALNEAGMHRARQRLTDSLAAIETAQTKLRSAKDVAGIRKTQSEQALAEAEWELDYRFEVTGNKTFLVTGDERKPMTADERRDWKRVEARKDEAVQHAVAMLAGADSEVAVCTDALDHARLAFSAARADLDAAITTVRILGASITKEVA